MNSELLRRAKGSIVKRQLFTSKRKMFIQAVVLRPLVTRALVTESSLAKLWLVAYIFLLRVPSEALPMERGQPGVASEGQSVLHLIDEKTIELRLKSRKNRQVRRARALAIVRHRALLTEAGSVLRRVCSCGGGGAHSMSSSHFSLCAGGVKHHVQVEVGLGAQSTHYGMITLPCCHLGTSLGQACPRALY